MLLLVAVRSTGQQNIANRLQNAGGGFSGPGGAGGKGGSKDSLKHRTGLEDSITINYRYLDSSRYKRFDSSINDFTKWYPIPADYFCLGNIGTAAKSLLFTPNMKAGWDAGFHSFDVYRFTVDGTRYFNTTRPYTELGYLLGSKNEQMVHVLHTQNINPNWNFAFQYRLLTSPGYFENQNTAQNNFSISSFYQSPNRRYHLFTVLLNNFIRASENGGIVNKSDLDNTITYSDRSTIPVYLGPTSPATPNPFTTSVTTGTRYKIFNFMLRQQYDLGIKDSIVTDSSVIQLFYPKLRLEYTAQINNYTYTFADASIALYNDTLFYRQFYNFISMPSTYQVQDKWNETVNDFSIYQFPDSKNPQQFIKVGATLQNLKGIFDASTSNYYNTWLHGEYRNKTRNQKWDIEATGELHTTGLNAADYSAYASLKRLVSRQIGYLQIGAQNVSRTPSFIFNPQSSFNFGNPGNYKKENTLRLFAVLDQPEHKLRLSGSYYLVTNYTYFKDYYHTDQAAGVFNLLQVTANKETRLRKHLLWISEITLQQKAGNAPVNVPLLFTRQRIGYEGTLGFPNLRMSTGLEFKYNTPYKADGYSPLMGQFYYQDTSTVSLRVPTISAYLHFRIRSFTAYVRLENLNTATTKGGFGFTNNNLAINGYPYPGMQIHVGIFWSFVN
ncbi:MAG TPA: putative porin [Chitinophagaceae bacterium]